MRERKASMIRSYALADATSGAFDSGEVADKLPFVSLPDTEMDGGDDPLALAMIIAEKQTVMKEQALRIQANEAKSGHHLQDVVERRKQTTPIIIRRMIMNSITMILLIIESKQEKQKDK